MTRIFSGKLIGLSVSLLALLGVLLLLAMLLAQRTQAVAARFVGDIRQLSVGDRDFNKLAALENRYSRNASISGICNERSCRVQFWFTNGWLSHLHLAQPAYLTSSITFSGGALSDVIVDSGCYPEGGGAAPFSVGVWESILPTFTSQFWEGGKEGTISVRLNESATPQQRAVAFGFDTHFLTRFGSCSGPNEMLPTLSRK